MPLPLLTPEEITRTIEGAWMTHGNCTTATAPDITEAEFKATCKNCPVTGHCLAYASLIDARDWVYGGLEYADRRELDNGQRYSTCSACGAGYTWTQTTRGRDPGVCSTCNGTKRDTTTTYAHGGTT